MEGRPELYRQSLIAAFDSCPLRARFALEDQRRTPGPLAARGTLLHRFVHMAINEMWANGERTFSVEQGMELLLEVVCQTNVPSEEVIPITMWGGKWLRVIVTKWCENIRLDPRRILAVEERFFAPVELPSGETVKITGQLDLLLADPPDGVIVTDFKSGFRRPGTQRSAQEQAEREGSGLTALGWVQWLIYSFLCFENFPKINRVIFREVHVLWNEERQARMERWEMERLKDTLTAQVALLHRAVQEGPKSAIWVPSSGSHCALCANPRACPIKDVDGIPADYTEAQRIAREWVKLGHERDSRREILYGAVEHWGPIEIPHSDGRRVVGWDYSPDGKRNFRVFEPKGLPESPYDEVLASAAAEAGVLRQ